MTNSRVSKLLRSLFFLKLETFDALRHREFRFYWLGFVISVSGQQMLWMIEGWLIYERFNVRMLSEEYSRHRGGRVELFRAVQ